MLTPAQLDAARTAQNSLMLSTGIVTRPGNGWVYVDGVEQREPDETVYTGPLRLQRSLHSSGFVQAGAESLPVAAYVAAVPWNVTGIIVGDVVTVTASDDPAAVGRRFTILDVELNALAVTARRFHCELLNEHDEDDEDDEPASDLG